MTAQPRPQTNNFAMLDAFRGVGAVIVLIGHTIDFWGLTYSHTGAVFVDVFFLISGFVIAFAYDPKLAAGMKPGEFLLARIIRLYPLYLLSILLAALLGLAVLYGDADGAEQGAVLAGRLATQLFMLPTWEGSLEARLYTLNGPAWTLLAELFANLIFVLLWPRLTIRVLIGLVVVFATIVAVCTFAYQGIDSGALWGSLPAGLARGCFGFFGGVLVYRLIGAPRAAPSRRSLPISILLLVAGLSVCLIVVPPSVQPFVDLVLVLGLGMPVLWLAQSVAPPHWVTKSVTLLGRMSYAIYIIHVPIRDALIRVPNKLPEFSLMGAPWAGMLMLVVVLIAAYVAERFYDRPVRRWIARKVNSRRPRQAVKTALRGASPQAAE